VRSEDWDRLLDVLAINAAATALTCPMRLVCVTGYDEARDRAFFASLRGSSPYARTLGLRLPVMVEW
jgi:hypothetical protein